MESSANNIKIGAVLVLYNPDAIVVANCIQSLSTQVWRICIVDNSSADNSEKLLSHNNIIDYIPMYKNIGIAAAQNVGIKHLIDNGCDYILLTDQDSIIPQEAVRMLLTTYTDLKAQGIDVGGTGSYAYNKQTNKPYPYGVNFIREQGEKKAEGERVVQVSFLMNSISLFPVSFFHETGLMCEPLFIDGVDSEICWRATHLHGKQFFINENVKIMHLLGLGSRNMSTHTISITPPYRFFYQMRNYLWLSRCKYVPRKWIIYNGIKYLMKLVYYPLFMPPRIQYINNMYKGVIAGLNSKPKEL